MGLLDALFDSQFRGDVKRGLLDAANRGVIGGLLGAPVDMMNGLVSAATMAGGVAGHELGLLKPSQLPQPSQTPVGGSEWIGQKLQNAGIVSPERNPIAEALAGVALPAAVARVGPSLFAAEQAMAKNMAAPDTLNRAARGQLGATVYHGTPHKFDKFDSSKIGTGEGAQAYGHGLYVAESPQVAKSYQKGLTERDFIAKVRATYDEGDAPDVASAALMRDPALSEAQRDLLVALKSDDYLGFDYPHQAVQAALRSPQNFDMSPQTQKALDQFGNLYKVDLPDSAIAKMLDWDKPLSQQSKALQDSIANSSKLGRNTDAWLGAPAGHFENNVFARTGQQIQRDLMDRTGMNPQAVTDHLRSIGIPGVRYLDGSSRSAGQGTSNYVVFPGEENLLTILERNGVPIGK